MNMMKFTKYTKNLSYDGHSVFSYGTRVAFVEGAQLVKLGYWSATTSKHINYAAAELDLTVEEVRK